MTYKILTVLSVFLFSFAYTTAPGETTPSNNTLLSEISSEPITEELTIEEEISQLYTLFSEKNSNIPSLTSFKNGMMGYYKLQAQNLVEKEILTIIDFSLSSTKKRMWVLDMKNHEVLIHSVVAHGKNTGGEFATQFSNKVNSLQSSLGFYLTAETYMGGNGYSLFIDGMEEEFNSKARERYVVIHGAGYANPESIKGLGRLGRSYGCPAVPTSLTNEFIDTIKERSVLYIHSNDKKYIERSKMIRA
ncbi:murein L,D-transpeptidase catalytic domain family protein [Antarcticibacterium arcticum]|uniref:Murein L,D-transpeptidase catalytic domain family protein n=1 Tax=Antarcticibacterium arcticum TaxID=2585771 RepID=A0A5B8YE66_9FLAO|nr:murein L,D-transpeptidase catalytic domain family protein [Antarcticibacterium arcticum]QED36252.1 murein L,D-transpeptidase catalytic domain family protein [Antarcticibacterium arcticum]